jgi:hypothetical protein
VSAKAKQMNVNNESRGEKAQVFNRRMFHDIAIVKEDDNGNKTLSNECLAYLCG